MAGYNRVVMMGNLTRDPESKQLPSGQTVCRLGLAANRQFKNRQTGMMVQEVCFVDIDVWGAQADSCSQYLQKGRSVLIEGRLKFDSWEDPNGNMRSKHSITADRVVFLSNSQAAETGVQAAQQNEPVGPKNAVERELMDQLEKVQQKAKVKSVKKVAVSSVRNSSNSVKTGEVEFKDEPPFKEDLPF